MRRLKSWGSQKAKADATQAAADQDYTRPWPTAESHPAQTLTTQQHLSDAGQTTGSHLSDDELRAMEQSALEYAIMQSQKQTDSPTEEASTQQTLSSVPEHVSQPEPHLQQEAYTPFQANAQPLSEAKKKGMAKLKQRLSLKKQPSQNLAGQQNPYPMAAGGHHPGNTKANLQQQPPSAAWGSHSTQATPSMSGGAPYQPLESGNGAAVAAAVAASELSAHESGQLSEHRSLGQQQEEEAMMELAIKESEVQAAYDNVLREAKLLRLDLQHSLTKLLENRVTAQQEHAELSELMGDFGLENAKGKGIAADHAIEQQFVESEYNLEQATTRVTAVTEAISELQNLEHFIRSTKPPQHEAVMLTEEIVRQLLERLNFLKLSFAPPEQQPPPAESAAIVGKFRQQQRQLPGPATPQRPTQAPPRPPSPAPAEDDFIEPAAPRSVEGPNAVSDGLYEESEQVAQPEPSMQAAILEQAEAGPSTMSTTNPFEDYEQEAEPAQETSEASNTVLTPEQPTQFWGQAAMQGRLPEGATAGRLPEQAMLAPPVASSSHMGTGSTTPSYVTDESAPDSNPNHVTQAPAPTPSYLPTSPTSVTSPRALNHMDSHRSTRSTESTGSNGNLAMSQSKEQSRQLLEKASQKLASLLVNANDKNFDATRRPGEAAIRRAPQVVHLYQELRRMMGEDFMLKELNSQNPRDCILQGMQPYQAPSPAEEQARQRALSEQPSALRAAQTDAEKHARMLSKLGGVIRSSKFRSMPEVVSFVQEAQEQLAVLRADEGLVVSQLEAWPKPRLDVLREAAGQYQELNYITMKYKKWMLQQGTCLQEAERIEEFFDTARARVEWLASRQDVTERRFATHQVPWDRSVFKTTRHAGLHLGVIYMSRILFEVANLERSTTLRNEECLLLLADATRLAYKTHQYAGGFNVDSAELFGKVKRLTQYYTRSMDPTWLKDNTKFSSSNRQKWDHVARK